MQSAEAIFSIGSLLTCAAILRKELLTMINLEKFTNYIPNPSGASHSSRQTGKYLHLILIIISS